MVTNSVVNLPTETIEAGWNLLDRLRAGALEMDGLFWAAFDEGDWRLFLSTSLVATVGPRAVYNVLIQEFAAMTQAEKSSLSPEDVVVVNPEQRVVQQAREWARGRYGSETVAPDRRLVRRTSLGEGDVYIYFLD